MAVIIGVPPLVTSASARICYRHPKRRPRSHAPYRNALSYIYTTLSQSSPVYHKNLPINYIRNHGQRF